MCGHHEKGRIKTKREKNNFDQRKRRATHSSSSAYISNNGRRCQSLELFERRRNPKTNQKGRRKLEEGRTKTISKQRWKPCSSRCFSSLYYFYLQEEVLVFSLIISTHLGRPFFAFLPILVLDSWKGFGGLCRFSLSLSPLFILAFDFSMHAFVFVFFCLVLCVATIFD